MHFGDINICASIQISLKFVTKDVINYRLGKSKIMGEMRQGLGITVINIRHWIPWV